MSIIILLFHYVSFVAIVPVLFLASNVFSLLISNKSMRLPQYETYKGEGNIPYYPLFKDIN